MADRDDVVKAVVADRRVATEAALGTGRWDMPGYRARLVHSAASLETAGLVDPGLMATLDCFERDLALAIWDAIAGEAVAAGLATGEAVAENVFGDRTYRNRLDRQLAVGASAVGAAAAEERVALALDHVLRQLLVDDVDVAAMALPGSRRRAGPPPPPPPLPPVRQS